MKKAISCVLILGTVIALWVGVFALDHYQYNNGICRKCHGQYEFFDVGCNWDNLTCYYYECSNCQHICKTYIQY